MLTLMVVYLLCCLGFALFVIVLFGAFTFWFGCFGLFDVIVKCVVMTLLGCFVMA